MEERVKKALLTDYAGICKECKRPIESETVKSGYVEYYEWSEFIFCKRCSDKK